MGAEASEHVVQVEGGELAVLAPLEAGAGGQGHSGVTGGPAHSRGMRRGLVHGEAEMC